MRSARFPATLIAYLMALVAASCSAPPPPPEPTVSFSPPATLPHAVAPPSGGVAPPAIRLLGPNPLPLPLVDRPQQQLDGWAGALSEELDIPKTALEAYGYAQSALRTTQPQCGMTWTVLAGISQVESNHGRYDGARLNASGYSSIPIRGMPLSGKNGTKLMQDTGPDGSPEFVRAMGSFQFLPITWQKWGRDADGDGIADPDDIYDAALTAGVYLCATAGDIRQPAGFWNAVFIYNNSHSYGQQVLDYADYYGRASSEILRAPAVSGAGTPPRSER